MKTLPFGRELALLALLALAAACRPGYESGLEAYERGDYARAMEVWLPRAERGEARAQYGVGHMYDKGHGVPPDAAEAVRWYRKAAEQGHVASQFDLAVLYQSGGQGVAPDLDRAAEWYLKAAEAGVAGAQYYVGKMYYRGEGMPKNDDEAFKWIRKAAEQGDPQGMNHLGILYSVGRGTGRDPEEAARWFSRAAEAGEPGAQRNLASVYLQGNGLPQDRVQALKWHTIAQASQEGPESDGLPHWAIDMTEAERAEARRLAAEWKPSRR